MKRTIIPFFMFCITYANIAQAEDTDLSAIDNVIYVASTTANAGKAAELSICMKNVAPIRGFQFNLYLPEGVTAVKNAKGRIQSSLSADRLEEDDEHTLSVSEQEDGSLLFLCGSQYSENFTGSEGEVATLTINVNNNISTGNYPIVLRNVKLTETDISKKYETEEVISTLTISKSVDSHIILDETSSTAPEASNGVVDVLVRRTIYANQWSTICLPFAMTTEQLEEAFGDDVQLADFVDCETEEDDDEKTIGITINFETATAIEANHPYIIKVTEPVTEFTVDGVVIDPEEEPSVQSVALRTGSGTKKDPYVYFYDYFTGTYVADTTVPAVSLFLNNNMFWYSTGATKMKGYRAYFELYFNLTEVENAYADVKMAIDVDGTSTRVEGINMKDSENTIFDLSGRRLSKLSRRGIYIVNGKKALIK